MHHPPLVARLVRLVVGVSLLLSAGCSVPLGPGRPSVSSPPSVNTQKAALAFVARGDGTPAGQRYQAHGLGGTLQFTPQGVALALPNGPVVEGEPAPAIAPLSWRFLGGQASPALSGHTPLSGRVSYLRGDDPGRWQLDLPSYAGVRYDELYPGIDLRYDDDGGRLKATYLVDAGADPAAIRWQYQGARAVSVEPDGSLKVELAAPGAGALSEAAPIAWQDLQGGRAPVDVAFVVDADSTVRFAIGAYDPALPLVIDPTLTYSTFLGGSSTDTSYYVAPDASGNVYVGGYTTSADFPLADAYHNGSPQSGDFDFFLTKYGPDGAVIFSTYLGGDGDDRSHGIAVDGQGSAVIVGHTTSTNFPLRNAQQANRRGLRDAVVVKFAADGQELLYSTLLGGSGEDLAYELTLGPADSVFVVGFTASSDFPVVTPIQRQYGGGIYDGFLTQLSADGQSMPFSTFVGGSNEDKAFNVEPGPDGDLYLTGYTRSGNFPLVNPYQSTWRGDTDVFASRLDLGSNTWVYSTLLGGHSADVGYGLDVDQDGNAYIVGTTLSYDFPTARAFQPTLMGGGDGFLTKVTGEGALAYSTFLGSPGFDDVSGVAVDQNGDAYVVGRMGDGGYPVVDPIQAQFGGGASDAFITVFNPTGQAPRFSSWIGGSGPDVGVELALDPTGLVYVTGTTGSPDFRTVAPAQGQNAAGSTDAFLVAIDGVAPHPLQPPELVLAPAALAFTAMAVGEAPADQSLSLDVRNADSLDWVASADQPWIKLSTSSGVAPTTLAVGVDPSGLAPGEYTGLITVSPADPALAPQEVPITLNLTEQPPPPELAVAPSALIFRAVAGGATPASQGVAIGHTGPSSLPWAAEADQPWITLGAATGQTPGSLAVGVDLSGLAPGDYAGNVTVRSTAPGVVARQVAISLVIDAPPPPPELSLSPTELRFSAVAGGALPPAQNVSIRHSGPADLTWTARADQPWILLDRITGTAPATLEVQARPGSLAPGRYTGTITVRLSDPEAAPRQVNVALTIEPAEPAPTITLETRPGYRGIRLAWTPVRGVQVHAYRILRAPAGETPLSEIGRERETRYLDTASVLTPGVRYCYRIEAVRADNSVLGRSNLSCAVFGQVALWVPDVQAAPGRQAIIPVNIANAHGLNIAAADIWLDIDGRVIEPVEVRATPLSAPYTWSYGVSGSGESTRVRIAALSGSGSPLSGDGSLFWLVVRVRGAAGASSALNLREYVTEVGGSTIYTTDDLNQPVPLTLQDGTFRESASYGLGDLNGNGTIEAVDAYIALQIAVGQIKPNGAQLAAGDVNGNGRVDAADGTLILYHAAHGDWPAPPKLGASSASLLADGLTAGVQVQLGSAAGRPGTQVAVSLTAEGLSGWAGGNFIIAYDPALVERIDGVSASAAAQEFGLRTYDDGAGLLTVALADDIAHNTSGALLTIRLTLRSDTPAGAQSPLVLADAQFNDASGRDFATSSLARTITRSDGALTVSRPAETFTLYLPAVRR